jgi:hypothetical protein
VTGRTLTDATASVLPARTPAVHPFAPDTCWTTEYYQLAVQDLQAKGRSVPDEILAHISPVHSENVNFFGVITGDVEAELAKLDPAGWRPLRPAAPDLSLLL